MSGPRHEGLVLFDPDRLTESYRQALVIAAHEVRRNGHTLIEPEHLLIGMLARNGAAAAALYDAGASLAAICRRVESALGVSDVDRQLPRPVHPGGPQLPRPGFVGYSTEAKDLLESSFDEANRFRHNPVTTAHLLSAIVRHGHNGATRVLKESDVHLERVRDEALSKHAKEE